MKFDEKNVPWRILFERYSLAPRPLALHVPLFSSFNPPLSPLSSQAVLVWQLGLRTARKVDGGFVFFIAVDMLEVHHHVQGVGQDEEQDQRRY